MFKEIPVETDDVNRDEALKELDEALAKTVKYSDRAQRMIVDSLFNL